MARPRKSVVDYFPHSVNHGKTMAILEQRWGNDGYAFWFKLLEHLGRTERHHIHWNHDIDRNYFCALARVDIDTANEILNLLSDLGGIDSELWKNGIIYSQNFVDGVEDAYKKRKQEVPSKSLFSGVSAAETTPNTEKPPVSKSLRGQKSLKESKGKKRKGYSEFQNVFLSDEEHEKLTLRFGDSLTDDLIDRLSLYLESSGKKYKSHYATILNWGKKEQPKETKPHADVEFDYLKELGITPEMMKANQQ